MDNTTDYSANDSLKALGQQIIDHHVPNVTPIEQGCNNLAHVKTSKLSNILSQPENQLWTDEITTLMNNIVENIEQINWQTYANSLGDSSITEKRAPTQGELQIIIADYTIKQIKESGLNIGQLPTLTDKEPKIGLLFNGRYWQSISHTQIKELIKKITKKTGLNELKYQAPRFYKGILEALWDRIDIVPKPQIERVLLNLNNGTLEFMPDGNVTLHPHNYLNSIRYYLPYEYNTNAKYDQFYLFIQRVLPDEQSRIILQELIGTLFILHIKFEKIGILLGSGSNGKSVFLKIIESMFGNANVSNMSLKDLTIGDKAVNNRAQLLGKRVNISTEIDSKGIQDHTLIKKLASREPATFKWLYQDTFTSEAYAMLLFACNDLPRDVEHTLGFFRRFLLIHFDQTIPENEQDRELANKIIANELPGILNWAIEGFKRMCKQQAFSECRKSEQLLADYKLDTDSVALFLQDNEYMPGINKKELSIIFSQYSKYCQDNHYKYPVSKKMFGTRLRNLEYKVDKSSGNKTVIYIDKSV